MNVIQLGQNDVVRIRSNITTPSYDVTCFYIAWIFFSGDGWWRINARAFKHALRRFITGLKVICISSRMSMIHKIVIPRHLSSLSYSKWPSGPAWSHLSKYSRCIISRHLLHNKRDERDSFVGIMFIRTYRDPIVIRSVNQDSPIVLPSNLISSAIHLFNLRSSISLLFSYFSCLLTKRALLSRWKSIRPHGHAQPDR